MVLYVNIALAYCKLERWTPVFFCYKIWLFSIQSYLRCSSVWYPPHTRVKKSKRKSLTKYTDLAQSNSRYFTSYYMQYLCLPCLPIVCGDFTTTFRNPYAARSLNSFDNSDIILQTSAIFTILFA